MKTTELFNFPFVDRTYERDIINNFFNNKSETTLWIKGASGFGKQHFLTICMIIGINIRCVM